MSDVLIHDSHCYMTCYKQDDQEVVDFRSVEPEAVKRSIVLFHNVAPSVDWLVS